VVAVASSRHRPVVKLLAVDRDGHVLGGFVDFNQQFGVSRLAKRQRRDGGGGQLCDEAAYAHWQTLVTLNRKSIELVLLVVVGLHDALVLVWRFGPCLLG